jgi:hypothetical protein
MLAEPHLPSVGDGQDKDGHLGEYPCEGGQSFGRESQILTRETNGLNAHARARQGRCYLWYVS